ncbi:peptide ABC transporter substrate-binding protein [Jiangella mangrovi]|uniref:Oligopeptide transport system substrate-binding protein n=1 Tax=Jiangella mangrovi TaxID=1524084 RepID=A0A7W9LJB1_9ACTN|nr:ABC transporter substrate-binding protein [Jiangella mangrovi]MBB5785936.1 oligopeptide transport system substrate-binding protein [Jiangella mangrovi]
MPVSRRTSVVLGAVALALTLGACGGGDDGAAADGGNTVTVRGCNPQSPFVPANTNEVCGGDVLDQIFSFLVRYNPEDGQPENEIAADISTEDSVTWTITLKDGWTFHDGTPVTSSSFVDAWNWAASGANATLNSYFFEPIAGYAEVQGEVDDEGNYIDGSAAAETMSGLAVVDDLTFTVTLSQPESQFPMRLGYTAFAPLPQSFFEDPEAFGQHPIGTGPFQFDSWEPNIDIRISAYEDYAGDVKPSIDGATYRIYENDDAAYNDLQADQLDIMPLLPTSALAGDTYKIDLGERFVSRPTGVLETMTFAPSAVDSTYDEAGIRQAISMAIDRPLIVDKIFSGARIPANGWVSPVVPGFQDGACGTYCTYDAAAAKTLFDDSGGYDGTITISYNSDSDHKAWVDAVCTSITNALDVPCLGRGVVDLATFRDQITAREMGGVFRTGWQMDYPSLENFLVPVFATGASANDGDYSNPDFDAAVKAAAANPDAEAAAAGYREAEQMLAADMPAIPLWNRVNIAGYSTHVENVQITIFQTVDLLTVRTTTG